MRLGLNPLKLVLTAWPVYALALIGALVDGREWRHAPILTTLLLASPVLIFAIGAALREFWWLELCDDALVHRTLARAERYAWSRMGPVELRLQEIARLPVARTLWFPFPLDEARDWRERITQRLGRRILLVFGDRSAKETAELVEAWRLGRRLS